MATWELDLKSGDTVDFDAETLEEAVAEQGRLNAEIVQAQTQPPRPADSFLQNVGDVAGEGAAAFNRSLLGGFDYVAPGAINAAARLSNEHLGTDLGQMPTLGGLFQEYAPGAEGGFMEQGSARDMVQGLGGALPAAVGMMPVTRNLASPVQAGAEFLGLGAARPQAAVPGLSFAGGAPALGGPAPVTGLPDIMDQPQVPDILNPRGRQRQMGELIEESPEATRRAGYAIDPYTGRAGTDIPGRQSMKQGFKPDFVAMVEGANESTKLRLGQMLDKIKGRKETRRAAYDRPMDVAGDAYLDRARIVKDERSRAASQLDGVAKSLKGKPVENVSTPLRNFAEGLADMGVGFKFNPDTQTISGSFDGSDIEGLDGLTKLTNRMLKRIFSERYPDAYDMHRLKRYIDENVNYDRSQSGLSGTLDTMLKRLRSQIDGNLDVQFPEYNRVNSTYSESTQAMKEMQRLVGKNVDFEGKYAGSAVGQEMRALITNYKKRTFLENNMDEMQALARKYAGRNEGLIPYEGVLGGPKLPRATDIEDDLRTLVMFNDELESVFGSSARGSMQGIMDKAADRAAVGVLSGQSGVLPLLEAGTKWGLDKVRGVDEDRALQAMENLINRR